MSISGALSRFPDDTCHAVGTAPAPPASVTVAVRVGGRSRGSARGGVGRHWTLTCAKQGQLPFEDDSCPCLPICEVHFCCPSEYVVGRNASVYDE